MTQRRSVQDALDMAAAGMDAEAICKKLEDTGLDSTIYVTVDTLKYMKKGGRITPAAAALGTLLRLKPVLTIQGEKLDAFAKARTMKQARSMMITAITRDLETRFGDVTGEKTYIDVAHTDNDEMAQELAAELRELFPETEVHVDPLSLSVACISDRERWRSRRRRNLKSDRCCEKRSCGAAFRFTVNVSKLSNTSKSA